MAWCWVAVNIVLTESCHLFFKTVLWGQFALNNSVSWDSMSSITAVPNSHSLTACVPVFYPLLTLSGLGNKIMSPDCNPSASRPLPSAGIICDLKGFSPSKSVLQANAEKGWACRNRSCGPGLLSRGTFPAIFTLAKCQRFSPSFCVAIL
uniref:Secreted protein n=1 Tax=Apteryx owenii TaxID=8824 RepID=A0A8B9Q321_APTOW